MSKKIGLRIAEPCTENWSEMTPKEGGRHCGSCQKTVVDFTGMSDRQLAEWFRGYKGGACGRLSGGQLNRLLPLPAQSIPFVRPLFAALLPVVLLSACEPDGKISTGVVLIHPVSFADSAVPPPQLLPPPGVAYTHCEFPTIVGDIEVVPNPEEPVFLGGIDAVGERYLEVEPMIMRKEPKRTELPEPIQDSLPYCGIPMPIDDSVDVADDTAFISQLEPLGDTALTPTLLPDTSIVLRSNDDLVEISPNARQSTALWPSASLTVYPNPVAANGTLHLRTDAGWIGKVNVSILAMNGQVLFETGKNLPVKGSALEIVLPGLVRGTYIIRIMHESTRLISTG